MRLTVRPILARFNTRARARRAHGRPSSIIPSIWFQHTCPREAGTASSGCNTPADAVSTHVPARGGHGRKQGKDEVLLVSTHVPARGGHASRSGKRQYTTSFNTRARARRARRFQAPLWLDKAVSTHVPARGGHHQKPLNNQICNTFQHTCPREAGTADGCLHHAVDGVSTHVPARGGHPVKFLYISKPNGFQHTCPREAGTCTKLDFLRLSICFNTRARARRAHRAPYLDGHHRAVSTHVPARGGHFKHLPPPTIISRFNTRARARRAPVGDYADDYICMFQHTCPREAGTFSHSVHFNPSLVSTHVPARGGHRHGRCYKQSTGVSTHVPARGGH